MALVYDDYEQDYQRNKTIPYPELSTHGYIEVKLEQDPPMFSKVRMTFKPTDKITRMVVSNNYVVLAMANNVLFRMNLTQPEQHEDISFGKYAVNTKLTNMYIDPFGQHLLLTLSPNSSSDNNCAELMYMSVRKSLKLKSVVKCRGHEITQVAWSFSNESETSTGPVLLGTSKGLIFETELCANGDKIFQLSLEQYWRQVFDIGKNTNTPITGLVYHRLGRLEKYVVLVTTTNRLYHFIGHSNSDDRPLLQPVFNCYLNTPERNFYEIPTKSNYSKLQVWYDKKDGYTPKAFGWFTQSGILYFKLTSQNLENFELMKENYETIPFPKASTTYDDNLSKSSPSSQKPVIMPHGFVLTEFHVLLAYGNVVRGVCVLNKELIFEDNYNEAFGKIVNIVHDSLEGTIWTVTENAVFRYKIVKEERNVWQIYCNQQQFELAKQYAFLNQAHYDQVLVKEADMLFETKRDYKLSAERYAETQSSFEAICLKFMEIDCMDALNTYLERKLQHLKPQDKTQITMLVLWVVELYLRRLADLRLADGVLTTLYVDLQKDFEAFLKLPSVVQCIRNNKGTIYDLMASHGDKHNLIKLTVMNKDFEQVIRQHIYKNHFLDALDVLKSQNRADLFYQFAPILMQEIPKQMVNALIEQGRNVQAVRLLPAFVSCENHELLHTNETIRYLEHCVLSVGCNERSIHNLLLSLYANTKSKKLMEYLAVQGQDITMVNYDVHFALRLCRESNLLEACVQLSALMGLWESAVDLALEINVELAKQIANQPQNDNELRKKLWLKIAQHVITGKDDIEKAMELLQQCDLIRIEDVLEFFSDFVTIDHFKDAICQSLQECNQYIQDLKEEMHEATESAERVRNEIQTFRNRYTFINAADTCSICTMTLMVRPFYLFPCGHRFHSDCLLKDLTPTLGPAERNKLHDLNRQLSILNTQAHNCDNVSTSSASLSARDQVKQDIDCIVASECLYCGETMIRQIDKPFIDYQDYDKIMTEWQ